MALVLADDFDAGVAGTAPAGWTIDGAAWTTQAAPSGLSGLVARAAQNNVTDQFLTQAFTRKTSGIVALRFQFKTGASVGSNLRWADGYLYDGSTKIARLVEANGSIILQNNNASVSAALVASAANTVYKCILFVDITNAKMWAYVNGTRYDNAGAKYALNVATGVDTAKFSNYGGSASTGAFTYIDDLFLASYAAGADPTGVPTVGTVTAAGSVNGNACGGDKNARIRLKYTEPGSGQVTDRATLYRATASGGSFSKVPALGQDSISAGGSPNAWEAVDRRPQWGSPAIAYGGTAYYKAAGENVFGASAAQTAEVNAVTDVDLTACLTARATTLSGIMAGSSVPSSASDEEYPGYWMTAMAYAYYLLGAAQYKTDCLNQFNYIKTSLTNADGLIQLAADSAASAIFRDHHSRTVIHAAIAARLLRRAGDAADAAAMIAQCDVWAKAFFDKLNSGNPAPTQTFSGWDANNTTGLGYQQAWQASHAYALGEVRRPTTTNGHTYRCTTAGTSGGAEPTWPIAAGGTVADGTCVWTETTVTVACSYAQYNTTTGYPGHSSGQHASDLNQNSEEALMCALLLTDSDSAFYTAGTYRTKAQSHVDDQIKLVLAHETSAGAITLGTITGEAATTCTAKHNYDSMYGNYAMQQLSAVQKLLPAQNPYLSGFLSRALAFSLSTFYGTEPLSRRRYNIADPGISTAVPFYDLTYLSAAAAVTGTSNPQAKLIWSAAFQLASTDKIAANGYTSTGATGSALADPIQAEMFDGDAYAAAVIGLSAAIGQATETDTAEPISVPQSSSIGQATETDIAEPITAPRIVVSVPILVREKPPLRHSIMVETPSGRRYRWGSDAARPEDVPGDFVKSSTMPGGFETFSCTLARDPTRQSPDLERLSTITVHGPGGDVRGEYRLDNVPYVSGDQMAVTPAAVGWQAHLDDNEIPGYIYADQDPSQWGDMPLSEKINQVGTEGRDISTLSFSTDPAGGIVMAAPNAAVPSAALAEAWYTAPPGVSLAKFMYIGEDASLPAGYLGPEVTFAQDDSASGSTSTNGLTLDGALRSVVVTPDAYRYAFLNYFANGISATPALGSMRHFSLVAVYGDHGLALYAIDATTGHGVLASDVEAHALSMLCPKLNFSTGSDGSIQPSSFVIAQLAFRDVVKASDIIKAATRFELREWAVWENRTYYSNKRGARGRKWRARVGPSQLQGTGPQTARLWNAVMVTYQDTTGATHTAGPPGSGADTEDVSLLDADPQNPANQLGIVRCQPLALGVSTPAGAVAYGARFLVESKLADNSGQATLVGYVEDDRGVLHAASEVRAGDQISFTDAHDPSYRYIVREEYQDVTKTCEISLDAPPDGMQQLLERYNETLAPLGLGS